MSLVERAVIEGEWLTQTGLELPQNLSFEQWEEIGSQLRTMEQSVQWWIGDWLNYGERKWGESYAQAVEETGKSYSTLTKYASVASRFKVFRRRKTLPWSHHEAVCVLPENDWDTWLDRAENEHWSVGELRGRIRNKAPDEVVVNMTKSRAADLEAKAKELEAKDKENESLKAENESLKAQQTAPRQVAAQPPSQPPAPTPTPPKPEQPKPPAKDYPKADDAESLEVACQNLVELAQQYPQFSSLDKTMMRDSLAAITDIVGRYLA